jgi:hypothetical protein
MIDQALLNEIKRVLIEQAQSDTVGLWTVIWDIEHADPAASPEDTMRATLAIVRSAIAEHGILVGNMVDHDDDTTMFVPWQLPVDEAIARIEREWSSLGRMPHPGDIAWFVAPGLLPVTSKKHPLGKDWRPRA